MLRRIALAGLLLSTAAAAQGQALAPPSGPGQPAAIVISIPPLTTSRNEETDAGKTASLGAQVAQLIAADLRSTGAFLPLAPSLAKPYYYSDVTAPNLAKWRSAGARALVTGLVNTRPDGRLTVGCYLFDVERGREVARKGFAVAPAEWRRAAHGCADAVYSQLTGKSGYFDTRIAYVAETGAKDQPIKRLVIMDFDGSEHRYLTRGAATVITPRFAPDGRSLAYVSYIGRQPQVRVLNIGSGEDRPLVPGNVMSFAPNYSPEGRQIAFSMASGGNTDIYIVDAGGGAPTPLTGTPGANTSPSFSPDGTKIVFESDRSGSPQLYVMNADGTGQRRISFGAGNHSAPAWSPKGDLIAFAFLDANGSRIGIMTPNGADKRMLSEGPNDEGPSWGPNGEHIMFQRTDPASGRRSLLSIPAGGGRARQLATPQEGSDPSWSTNRS